MIRLVFDIGGTHQRMALAEGGALTDVRKVSTPQDPEEALMKLVAYAEGRGVEEAVGGVAGIIENGTVMDAPNLRSWEGFSLAARLTEALKVPVRVYNDAELAGIGEALKGAGKGYARVGYLAVGTGVGGALVVNTESGPHIEGAEPGRLVMDLASGRTLESFLGGAALSVETGMRPELLSQQAYDERTPVLAEGIRMLCGLWAPDIFILNGPLVLGTPAFRIEKIMEAPVPIVPSLLKDESGLWGGALV